MRWPLAKALAAVWLVNLFAPMSANAGVWETMHPQSFPPTVAAAREQCERTAGQSSRDALTLAHCAKLETMLADGQCQPVSVPDGITYTYMNYDRGLPRVARDQTKRLGGSHPAVRCQLGDGIVADWYNEPQVGCNNVGFQIPRLKVSVPREPVCHLVLVEKSQTYASGSSFGVSGVHVHDAYCGHDITVPGFVVSTPGFSQTSSSYVRVCK